MSEYWFDRETLEQKVALQIQHVEIVLDIGCGIRPQIFFKPKIHILCDPCPEYIEILQNRFMDQSHYVFLKGSWEEVLRLLPDRSVDAVFLLDVVEHLEKEEGRQLIHECERIARRQIILFTPLGFLPQDGDGESKDGWGLSGGRWQVHRSGWTPKDFDPSWEVFGSKTYHHLDIKGERLVHPRGAFYAIKSVPRNRGVSLPTKLFILSRTLPPSPSGPSVMLYRLLKLINSVDYCLVSSENYDPFLTFQNSTERLCARYFHLPRGRGLRGQNWRGIHKVCHGMNMFFQLIQRTLSIHRILKQEKCRTILACSGDLINLFAGYLASRLDRVPFYAYLCDDDVYEGTYLFYRRLAGGLEARVFRKATGVVVTNEFKQGDLRRRHGIQSRIIRNACEASLFPRNEISWPNKEGEISITYMSMASQTHHSGLQNLTMAIQQLGRPEVKIHYYAPRRFNDLERQDIANNVMYHPYLSTTQTVEVQQQADILFLPLPFDFPIPELVRTTAPVKMGEYLSSGRAILVHAPPDTYLNWYFKEYDCGLVVDRDDPVTLGSAIQQIIDNRALRERLCKNGLLRARTDFDIEAARSDFIKLFQNGKER